MCGDRNLEWVLIEVDGSLPRPAIVVEDISMIIDINRKNVFAVDNKKINVLKVKHVEVDNGFNLLTAEMSDNYEAGVIFSYNNDELSYIYGKDNIKVALENNAFKL